MLARRKLTFTVRPVTPGPCDHDAEEDRYTPSRVLQHLVTARNRTCTGPGCGYPAAACDLDHTKPYDQGGPTCECNLGPLCRHCHRKKQAQGWQLTQTSPGHFEWTTPAGRTYTTEPTTYE